MNNKLLLGISILTSGCLWAQPANDNCASATPITVDANCAGNIYTNVGATIEAGETGQGCWGTVPNGTVWFTFTTGAAGVYDVSTLSSTGSPDTQLKIISGTCGSQTTVACNDDGATFVAAVTANLTAATTYLVQADIYGTATATFCLEVNTVVPPANDCIMNAIDITAQINSVSSSNLFDCGTPRTYASAAGTPSSNNVTGDVSSCDGGTMDKRDVWFKFTVNGTTPPAWLSVYQQTGAAPSYHAELYSGTPTGTCSSDIGGLTYVDCSAGHYSDGGIGFTPPGSSSPLVEGVQGGARDKGLCTTPIHPRVDISGLAAGDYYFRVYEAFGGVPPDGVFNLCAESAVPTAGTNDRCGTVPLNEPCGAGNPLPIAISIPNSGNNGAMGNAAPCTRTDEPQLALAAAGDLRVPVACGGTGAFTTFVGGLNNVMNNSAIYVIDIAADAPCVATGDVSFTNVEYGGTNGNSAQIQIITGSCNGGTSVAAITTTASCFDVRPAGGTWSSGPYWIVVDGQDGQLLEYDLNIDISYGGIGCPAPGPCVTVLGAELVNLVVQKIDENLIQIKWETLSEENTDYFQVQRTYDGLVFEDLDIVKGHGNSTNKNSYTTYDRIKLEKNWLYYRVKIVDLDGAISYSELKSLKGEYNSKLVVKMVNLLGQDVDKDYKGLVILIYNDGTTEKSMR